VCVSYSAPLETLKQVCKHVWLWACVRVWVSVDAGVSEGVHVRVIVSYFAAPPGLFSR